MTSPVELQDAWLPVGAPEKASSVESLTRGLRIVSVLEVGCGTGAVLAELARRNEVVRSRTYFPEVTYRHLKNAATDWRRSYYSIWLIAHRVLGSQLLSHVYYGHFAALVVPRNADDDRVVPHPLYWHPHKP